jgi:hypothetical protein
MKCLRGKLTYANVVATLALIVALAGGTAFAASKVLPKNSVGTKQIKNKAVTGAKIANGAVTGVKVKVSTLGTVPSATVATSAGTAATADRAATAGRADSATTAGDAQSLQGKSAAQIEGAAKLSCPSGTLLVSGYCVETAERAELRFFPALEACAEIGRLLPDVAQLQAYGIKEPFSHTEWTSPMFVVEGEIETMAITGETFVQTSIIDKKPFRCVVPPSS